MLSIIGLLVIASMTTLLVTGRVAPIVALTLLPLVGALAAGFSLAEISGFFETGLGSVMNVAVMLVFAILFFGVMNDVGLFTPFINAIVRLTRGNVIAVCVGTVVVAAVCHLDGSGATSFLICIPALLPLYQRLNMSPYLLLLLVASSTGVLNMLPWAGPIGRAAAVIGESPTDLWRPLIPVQGIALVVLVGMAVILGLRERRRIAARQGAGDTPAPAGTGARGGWRLRSDRGALGRAGAGTFDGDADAGAGTATTTVTDTTESDTADAARHGAVDGAAGDGHPRDHDGTGRDAEGTDHTAHGQRPRNPWLNLVLVLGVVTVLVWGALPEGYAFMIGLSLALLLNYPKVSDQIERIRAHGANALFTGAIILAAGSLLGVLGESGMLDSLAVSAVGLLPAALVPYLHLIVGFFGAPLDIVLSTDAYYFALLPVVESIVTQFGVESVTVVYAMAIGSIIGTFLSPFNPAIWMAMGLAGTDMGRHIRYSFFWMWGFSLVVLLSAVAIGVVAI